MPSPAALRAARHICVAASVGQLHAFRVDEVASLIDRKFARVEDRLADALRLLRAVQHIEPSALNALARHLDVIAQICMGCGSVYAALDPKGVTGALSHGLCGRHECQPDATETPLALDAEAWGER